MKSGHPGHGQTHDPTRSIGPWGWALPALLATLVTIPTWKVIFLGHAYWYRDLSLWYQPQRTLASAIVRGFAFPSWDPFLHGGTALWANPDNLVGHPTMLIYALAPAALALGLGTGLHLAFAALSMFFLSRRLGFSTEAAFLGGAAFSLSGTVLSLVNLQHLFLAVTLLPALILTYECWLQSASRRALVALALLGACGITSGGAEAGLCAALTLAGWAATRPSSRSLAERAAALAGCGLLSLLIAAPIWMPARELLTASLRGAGFPWDHAMAWSVAPGRLAELVVPGLLGDATSPTPGAWWGAALEDGTQPYLLSLFIGPVTLALAVLGALRGKHLGATRGLLGLLAMLGLLLALGRHLPGADILGGMGVAPSLRYPVKAILLAAFPIALLACAGLDALSQGRRRQVIGMAAGMLAAILAGTALVMRAAPDAAARISLAWLGVDAPSPLAGTLLAAAAHAAIGLVAFSGTGARARWLLVGGVTASLLIAGAPLNPSAPRERVEAPSPILEDVHRVVGRGRLFRDASAGRPIFAEEGAGAMVVAWEHATLQGYAATAIHVPVALHLDADGFAPERVAVLRQGLQGLPWERRVPLLSSAGVTAVLADWEIQAEGLVPEPLTSRPDPDLRLYRNERAADTARFVARVVLVQSERAAVDAVTDPGNDPRRSVVLVGSGNPAPPPDDCAGTVTPPFVALAPRQDFVLDASCDGFLVLSLPFQPGLLASVDGNPADLLPADVGYCAIRVKAGRHVVSWRYSVPSLSLAIGACLLGLACCAFLLRPAGGA